MNLFNVVVAFTMMLLMVFISIKYYDDHVPLYFIFLFFGCVVIVIYEAFYNKQDALSVGDEK